MAAPGTALLARRARMAPPDAAMSENTIPAIAMLRLAVVGKIVVSAA